MTTGSPAPGQWTLHEGIDPDDPTATVGAQYWIGYTDLQGAWQWSANARNLYRELGVRSSAPFLDAIRSVGEYLTEVPCPRCGGQTYCTSRTAATTGDLKCQTCDEDRRQRSERQEYARELLQQWEKEARLASADELLSPPPTGTDALVLGFISSHDSAVSVEDLHYNLATLDSEIDYSLTSLWNRGMIFIRRDFSGIESLSFDEEGNVSASFAQCHVEAPPSLKKAWRETGFASKQDLSTDFSTLILNAEVERYISATLAYNRLQQISEAKNHARIFTLIQENPSLSLGQWYRCIYMAVNQLGSQVQRNYQMSHVARETYMLNHLQKFAVEYSEGKRQLIPFEERTTSPIHALTKFTLNEICHLELMRTPGAAWSTNTRASLAMAMIERLTTLNDEEIRTQRLDSLSAELRPFAQEVLITWRRLASELEPEAAAVAAVAGLIYAGYPRSARKALGHALGLPASSRLLID